VNITATYGGSTVPVSQGVSTRFALTDVATTNFLADLYQIPPSIRVNYGSNQSVAEFYEEFYSNSDLETFLAYSGLPNATIPESNVYGDLPNDQSDPGGEAQLDVEYIMALAPGAETYFYSMADYNPNDPVNATDRNEGFLEYLYTVDTQEYPPLVHSLSYGDIENVIFNATNNGSVEYGERCNQEFMQMGLRGLTVLFSSGDDGIGSAIIRDNEAKACEFSHPEWPASSPYVTSVGATQLTDKYLPICGQQYSAAGYAWQGLPPSSQLDVQCSGTGETVCTSIFGGVITSGGGFSDVLNRSYYAPWQENVVDYYLRAANSENYPPAGYFNSLGRGYPDVATYGSNYFIYLNGQITRESGTSASAPVFAAMVTLWNDIRLAYGKPPMGFIAPFLYYIYEKNPDAFHDIVTGNNVSVFSLYLHILVCYYLSVRLVVLVLPSILHLVVIRTLQLFLDGML
jgi:tripeptidyl-peptidase-1